MASRGDGKVKFVDEDAVVAALADLRDDSTETDWMLTGYSSSKLALLGTGSGGLAELTAAFEESNANYGILRVTSTEGIITSVKFCFFIWLPDSTPIMVRAKTGMGFRGAVQSVFEPYHGEIFATELSEVSEEAVVAALSK